MKSGRFYTIIVIILVVIIGGTLYWFSTHASVNAAMNNLARVNTSDYSAHIVINNTAATQQLLGESGTIDLTLAGQFDRSKKPSDLQGNIDVSVKTNSVALSLAGELRMVKDKFYAIINTAPSSIPLFAQLKGQWIVLPRNAAPASSTAPSPSANLLTKVSRVGNETINNENTVHYRAVATSDAVIAMTTNMTQIIGSQLTGTQADQIRAGVAKTGEVPVDIWITPWTNNVRKISAVIPIPNADTVHFDLTLANNNKLVSVAEPQGALTLQQAAQKAQPKAAPAVPTPAPVLPTP
jgi:hypothetical protein